MDEKTIIREQERLAREAKRRKNRKKKQIAAAVIIVCAAAGIWYGFFGRNLSSGAEQAAVEVEAGDGQEITYASLISVRGNEIEYTVSEELQEIQTTQIPVGTEVITRLGTSTTFSRLRAGDNVALITEESGGESVIVKVYIIE